MEQKMKQKRPIREEKRWRNWNEEIKPEGWKNETGQND